MGFFWNDDGEKGANDSIAAASAVADGSTFNVEISALDLLALPAQEAGNFYAHLNIEIGKLRGKVDQQLQEIMRDTNADMKNLHQQLNDLKCINNDTTTTAILSSYDHSKQSAVDPESDDSKKRHMRRNNRKNRRPSPLKVCPPSSPIKPRTPLKKVIRDASPTYSMEDAATPRSDAAVSSLNMHPYSGSPPMSTAERDTLLGGSLEVSMSNVTEPVTNRSKDRSYQGAGPTKVLQRRVLSLVTPGNGVVRDRSISKVEEEQDSEDDESDNSMVDKKKAAAQPVTPPSSPPTYKMETAREQPPKSPGSPVEAAMQMFTRAFFPDSPHADTNTDAAAKPEPNIGSPALALPKLSNEYGAAATSINRPQTHRASSSSSLSRNDPPLNDRRQPQTAPHRGTAAAIGPHSSGDARHRDRPWRRPDPDAHISARRRTVHEPPAGVSRDPMVMTTATSSTSQLGGRDQPILISDTEQAVIVAQPHNHEAPSPQERAQDEKRRALDAKRRQLARRKRHALTDDIAAQEFSQEVVLGPCKEDSSSSHGRQHSPAAVSRTPMGILRRSTDQRQSLSPHRVVSHDDNHDHASNSRALVPYNDVSHDRIPRGAEIIRVEQVQSKIIKDPYGDQGYYTGVLVHGKPHGHGSMQYKDGRSYVGDWRYGRWHGHGRALFANGDFYVGEYKSDQRHGAGRYEWRDGRVYDGEFKGDLRHGSGVYTWPDGSNYSGEFQQGHRHGQGCYAFADGSLYTGEWRNGKYHGVGQCLWADGRSYRGEWKEGRADGYGIEFRKDGTVRHDGEWSKDRPIRKKQDPEEAKSKPRRR